MNAPNYIGEVRGIVDDLRNNYIKKQQLALQAQEQNNRMFLGLANLSQQSDLSQAKIDADLQQTETNKNVQLAQLNSQRYAASAQSAKDLAQSDLNERKFQFDLWKENNALEKEQREREQEIASARLLQEGVVALNSDDPTKKIEWANKSVASILNGKQQADLWTNALTIVNTKRKLESDITNLKTQEPALAITRDLNKLDVSSMTPDQFAAELEDYNKRFQSLGNTDPKINDLYMSTSQEVAKRQHDFRQKEYGQVMDSFLRSGNLAQLDAQTQKEFDRIHSLFPEGPARSSNDFSIQLQRLMFQSNNEKSQTNLADLTQEANAIEENIVAQNPSLAAVRTDPKTGEKYKVFPYSAPNLTPVVGFNGTIDPDTGLVNKQTLQAYAKWKAEVTSPTFLLGQVPFIRGLNMGAPMIESPAGKKQIEEAAAIPFRSSNVYNPQVVAAPGTAVIPTAPGAPKVQLSEDTVAKVVNLYNTNPDALIGNKSVKEVVARMLATGISLPGLRQTPESNVVNQGQKR
jgi:hypothetical protein